MTRDQRLATALVVLGLLQMTGDVLGLRILKGIGAATAASPAPKVFSSVNGLETYSTKFFLEWTDIDGRNHSMEITLELYSKLRGPYNRRNSYGAVLAYGPVLPPALRDPVTRYGLCGDAPILRELGVDPDRIAGHLTVRLEPLPGTSLGNLPTVFEVPCS